MSLKYKQVTERTILWYVNKALVYILKAEVKIPVYDLQKSVKQYKLFIYALNELEYRQLSLEKIFTDLLNLCK